MPLVADVTLNNETLAVMGAVIGTLWSSLVLMWRSDLQRRDREAAEDRTTINDLFRIVLEHGHKDEIPQRTLRRVDPNAAERRDQESGERPV